MGIAQNTMLEEISVDFYETFRVDSAAHIIDIGFASALQS
jgi:hypothetical protein